MAQYTQNWLDTARTTPSTPSRGLNEKKFVPNRVCKVTLALQQSLYVLWYVGLTTYGDEGGGQESHRDYSYSLHR
jgi:hypothetical protein